MKFNYFPNIANCKMIDYFRAIPEKIPTGGVNCELKKKPCWRIMTLKWQFFLLPHIFLICQPMVDTSVVIGEVSLRQVRVRLESCDIPYQSVLSSHCRPGYSDNTEDREEFFTNRTWYYGDSYLTRSEEIQGTHGSYGGGGYQIKLPHRR